MSEINKPVAGHKPVLALDVDGVLLVHGSGPAPHDYIPHPDNPRYISYNPKHGRWIGEIMSDFEVVYCTSHREDSHKDIGEHLSLPELDWVNFFNFDEPGDTSLNRERRPALEKLFVGRPLVWVDDEMEEIDFVWAEQRTESGVPTMAIQTNSEEGLEHRHIEDILEWYSQLAITGT